jgi:hypothetical protein
VAALPAVQETPQPRAPSRERFPIVVLLVSGALALALLLWATRDATFMQDEWDFIQDRLDNDDEAFLHPHNNHLLLLPVLLYKAVWSTVGLDDYWVVRILAFLIHLSCVGLLFQFGRRRLGDLPAALLSLPILVLGSAWEVLLIPFNLQWYLSVAGLIGILLLVEREGWLADLGTGALLLLTLASSSLGPPVAGGLAVACLIQRRWRRLGVATVPMVLYALWFLVYNVGAENQPPTELTASPAYLLHTAAGSIGGLLGVPLGARPVADRQWLVVLVHLVTVAIFAGLAFQLLTRRRALTPTLALILTTLAAYWLVLTVTRGYTGYAYTSRYLYVSCVLLVLLLAEYLRGRELAGRAVAAAAGVSVLAAGLNAAMLVHQSKERRHNAITLSAELAALEMARGRVAPDFRPDHDPKRAVTIVAQRYFAATDRLGSSPAPSPEELARQPAFAQRAADEVLIRAFDVQLKPSTPATQRLLDAAGRTRTRISAERVRAGGVSPRGRCLTLYPTRATPAVAELRLSRFGLSFRGPAAGEVKVALRGPADLTLTPPRGSTETVLLPRSGRSEQPWEAQIHAPGRILVC